MRPRRASRPADSPEPLALHDAVAELHVEALAVEEGAVESHAMIDDEQIALEREGRARREHDDPVGGRDERRSRGDGDGGADRKSTRLNTSHSCASRMPS